jgi:hypothetical protein
MVLFMQQAPGPAEAHLFGWFLGYAIAVVMLASTVACVAPILVLASRIARQAPLINQSLQQSYRNTLPLADLRQTIDHAEVIVAGLERVRARLGG